MAANKNTVTLDGVGIEMPPDWAATQMKTAFEASVIGQLTPSAPIPLGDYNIPVYEGGFEMGYTPEMGKKPVSGVSFSFKTMSPVKLAGIIVVSQEAARRNPAQMLTMVEQDMQNSVARAVDYAIFYGKSAYDGTAIPAMTSVNATTNRVELNLANDLVPQILAGYDLIVDESADPNGFAFDTRLRSRLALATQQQVTLPGAPAPMPNLGARYDNIAGLKAAYGRTVSGRVGTNADTKVRGFVGDWSKIRWGYATAIELARSTESTIIGADGQPIYLWQQNAMALRIEVTVGWTVLNALAFSAYEDQV